MGFTIRQATESDVGGIVKAHQLKAEKMGKPEWGKEMTPRQIREQIRKNPRYQWVAEDEKTNEIVGAIHVARLKVGKINFDDVQARPAEGFPTDYKQVCSRHEENGNALFAYKVTSNASLAGRRLVLKIRELAREDGGIRYLFTHSPSGDDARKFHEGLRARRVKEMRGGRNGKDAVSFYYDLGKGK